MFTHVCITCAADIFSQTIKSCWCKQEQIGADVPTFCQLLVKDVSAEWGVGSVVTLCDIRISRSMPSLATDQTAYDPGALYFAILFPVEVHTHNLILEASLFPHLRRRAGVGIHSARLRGSQNVS